MQKITLLLAIIILLLGCGQHVSEVWINKDTSGKAKLTFDGSGMLEFVGAFAKSQNSNSENSKIDDNASPFMEGKIDSTIVLYDIAPESIKQDLQRADLLKNMIFELNGDADKGELTITISLHYESMEELEDFYTQYSSLAESQQSMGMNQDDLEAMFSSHTVDYKNGIVRVNREDSFSDSDTESLFNFESKESLDSLRIIFDKLDDEDVDEKDKEKIRSLQQMFEVKSIFHLPGEVIFTNDPKANIDGNKVTFTDNIWEAMMRQEDGEIQNLIIKYNPI